MSMSQSELDGFHQFASNALASGGRDLSLEGLLRQWRDQQEEQEEVETIASIRRGIDDAEAGRVQNLADVDAKIRDELGFPARSR
jgi:hypothetical protein